MAQFDQHVQALRAQKWQKFFTGMGVHSCGPHSLAAHHLYPRDIEPKSVESLEGSFKWEMAPYNRHAMARGSKLRSYRIARSRIAHNRSYLNQRYNIFAGPIGFLP